MISNFFYWMKVFLGFSRKESKGFVLLIPFMVILILSPVLLRELRVGFRQITESRTTALLDSLNQKGVSIVSSPLPVFNPADTGSISHQLPSFRKIPFSESDSVTLQIVRGIGPSLAGRIIKFRENLGGFQRIDQLSEVYGLSPEVIENIWIFFDFDPGVKKKLKVNELGVNELSRHPYIGYGEAKVLVAFRAQHGAYQNEEDLLKIKIFDPDWVRKISPYLEF